MTEQEAQAPVTNKVLSVIETAELFREDIAFIESKARAFAKGGIANTDEELWDRGECIAQATLALRSLEDARMRMGKVIQYADTKHNGQSVYPR